MSTRHGPELGQVRDMIRRRGTFGETARDRLARLKSDVYDMIGGDGGAASRTSLLINGRDRMELFALTPSLHETDVRLAEALGMGVLITHPGWCAGEAIVMWGQLGMFVRAISRGSALWRCALKAAADSEISIMGVYYFGGVGGKRVAMVPTSDKLSIFACAQYVKWRVSSGVASYASVSPYVNCAKFVDAHTKKMLGRA